MAYVPCCNFTMVLWSLGEEVHIFIVLTHFTFFFWYFGFVNWDGLLENEQNQRCNVHALHARVSNAKLLTLKVLSVQNKKLVVGMV